MPAAHAPQEADPEPAWAEPAPQLTHAAAASLEYCPCPHAPHAVAPVAACQVPAAQLEQTGAIAEE
jgi:hypothetical protein